MKKLIIIGMVVVAAVTTNAAAWTWKSASGRLYDGQGTTTKYAGLGYLFNAGTVSQTALVQVFADSNGSTSMSDLMSTLSKTSGETKNYLSSGTFSSGRVSTAIDFTGPDSSFDAYFAVFGVDASGNNAIYISSVGTANYQAVGDSDISFATQASYSSVGFKDASAGYQSAGWYNVPEPTSALLLLLGFAGLALKRKNA